jgi:hypothetical protein
MATVKKGIVTNTPAYTAFWKHLRKYSKRVFWKRERKAARREANQPS